MPWWGFGALLLALLCSAGSFLVLHYSNGVSATRWPDLIAPNVCLSVLGSISTIAVTYAIGEGIAISWWRKAMRGASVKELHDAWSFSASATSILTQFKSFNVIALAALMAKFSIIDGILYQRATTTYIDVDWHPTSASISAWVKDYFPTTATMGFDNQDDFSVTSAYAQVVEYWTQTGNSPYFEDRSIKGCDGLGCAYNLAGMGFSFDCESANVNDDFVNTAPRNSDSGDLTLLAVNVNMKYPDQAKNYSRLEIVTRSPAGGEDAMYDDSPTCPTNFTITTCEVRPAVLNYTTWFVQANSVEESRLAAVLKAQENPSREPSHAERVYSVSLGTSGSTLGATCGSIPANLAGVEEESDEVGECWIYDPAVRQQIGLSVIKNIDLYEPWVPGANSSLLGLYQTLRQTLETRATISYHDGKWYRNTTGYVASLLSWHPPTDGGCAYRFGDPSYHVMIMTNWLTRMLSVSPAPYDEDLNAPLNVNVTGIQYFRDVYHTTDYKYAIAAMACTVAVVILVLPVYWKFW